MATNAAILAALGVIFNFGGLMPILLIFLPTTLGFWTFDVQHQFETTKWNRDNDWQLHHAALHRSSHFVQPEALQWINGNIVSHHVHHLYSRILLCRLPQVLRDHAALDGINHITIRESIANARLHLWDE